MTIEIEFLARDVARCVGQNLRDPLAHCATWFEQFDQEQRQVIYKLLFALRRCRRERRHQWGPNHVANAIGPSTKRKQPPT